MSKVVTKNVPDGLTLRLRYYHQDNSTQTTRDSIANHYTNQVVHGVKYIAIARLWRDEECVSVGHAICCSRDVPRKDIARAIAVGRAVRNYQCTSRLLAAVSA